MILFKDFDYGDYRIISHAYEDYDSTHIGLDVFSEEEYLMHISINIPPEGEGKARVFFPDNTHLELELVKVPSTLKQTPLSEKALETSLAIADMLLEDIQHKREVKEYD